jgi:fucose permease
MMCLAIAVNLIPVILTTLSRDLGGEHGFSKEQLGRVEAATFVGLVAGIVGAGPLADRLGAKPFAVAGNLLIGVGLALLRTAPSYAAVLVAAFTMGMGAGILDLVLSPIVCALQPDRRTRAMNWLHCCYSIGAAGTILAATLALQRGGGWRPLSLALVGLPALIGLSFVGAAVPPLVAERQNRMRSRALFREPYFLLALLAIFLGGATELGMAQWLPAYTEDGLGYSQWMGGMALLGFSVMMAVGRIAAGWVGHRFGGIRLMTASCSLAAVLYLISSFAPWRPVALGACIAVGLSVSCLWPSMLATTADRFPRGGASMFGMLAAAGNFGGIFMPWAIGLVADLSSRSLGLAVTTLCPVAMAVLLFGMRGRPSSRGTNGGKSS